MNNLEEILKNRKIIIILICIVVLIGSGIYMFANYNSYENINSIEVLEAMEKEVEENNEVTNENDKNGANTVEEEEKVIIAIHITGEVKKTGILYLEKGSRIVDAIEAAGGKTKNANLDQVNLAYVLEDGQKIYIPNKNEKVEAGAYIIANSGNNVLVEGGKNSKDTNSKGVSGKVNINSANQSELESLPGIGSALAQRIIEYRESNGDFEKIEDIQNVKGIGDSKYSNIKDNICI